MLSGFVDAHIHIESSFLIPSNFAHLVVKHGTVATINDPHEIANVNGIDGINFMINNSKKTKFNFFLELLLVCQHCRQNLKLQDIY